MDFWISFANFFASAIRLTAPIALGTLACTISERRVSSTSALRAPCSSAGFSPPWALTIRAAPG